MKQLKIKNEYFNIELDGVDTEKGLAFISVWNSWFYKTYRLKLYYRHEKTWNDHMGNTPCGYYVNINLPFNCGKRRFYIY